MKKIISVLLAVLLVASLTVSAFAVDNREAIKTVEAQIIKSAEKLFKDTAFNYENAGDFLLYIRSGADYDDKWDAFDKSVDEAIANGTDLSLYQLSNIVLCYTNSGKDAEEAFELIEKLPTVSPDFPSAYEARSIFEAASYTGNDNFIKTLQEKFLAMFDEGKGHNYWGYSCDNDAAFAAALAMMPMLGDETFDKYELADKVLALLENYKLDNGYAYAVEYGASPDTTAYVLMAKSLFDQDDTNAVYALLQGFANEDGTYDFGGEPSIYSTKNALLGLEYYLEYYLKANDTSDDTETEEEDEAVVTTTTAASKATTTPSTGDNLGIAIAAAGLSVFALAGAAVVKSRKED